MIDRGFRDIFARRYFANNGPMVQELDRAVARFSGVDYAVSVANEMMAMMLLAKSLFAPGEIVVPAYLSPVMVEALVWGGYTPAFADVDPGTWRLSAETIRKVLTSRTTGIVGAHFLGRLGEPFELERIAELHGLPLLFDASDALGCSTGDRRAGSFGNGEVFSLHESSLLNAAEGGCVTTRLLDVSNKMRTMRNFHLSETFEKTPLRMNGKMAESCAMLALAGLAEVDQWIVRNRERVLAYEAGLQGLAGIRLLPFDRAASNYVRSVIEIDEARAGLAINELVSVLAEENVFPKRPLASIDVSVLGDAPVVRSLRNRLLELPNSAVVLREDATRISGLIARRCARV
ncbi:MAG: DegT/DnrJ/EryC1/StrS family aminotransferase [Vulcanimicrobiaceae bacterium]